MSRVAVEFYVLRSKRTELEKECGIENDRFYLYAPDGKVYEFDEMLLRAVLCDPDNLSEIVKQRTGPLATEDGPVCWDESDFVYYMTESQIHDNYVVELYRKTDCPMVILDHAVFNVFMNEVTFYVPLSDWAEKHGKSVPAAKRQCQLGRVEKAVKIAGVWFVPEFAEYPGRVKGNESPLNVLLEEPSGVYLKDGDPIAGALEQFDATVKYLNDRDMSPRDEKDRNELMTLFFKTARDISPIAAVMLQRNDPSHKAFFDNVSVYASKLCEFYKMTFPFVCNKMQAFVPQNIIVKLKAGNFLEYYLDNLPVLVDKPDGPHIMLKDCDISYFVMGANV